MNLNFKLTDNFTLSEFLISDFFDQRIQPKVLKEFNYKLPFNPVSTESENKFRLLSSKY
jgi:uncharacterized membrane protein